MPTTLCGIINKTRTGPGSKYQRGFIVSGGELPAHRRSRGAAGAVALFADNAFSARGGDRFAPSSYW